MPVLTLRALARRHVVADFVPARSVGEGLLEAFPSPPAGGGRVLLPRAAVAREVVPEGLRAAGWQVDVVEAYRTVPVRLSPAALASAADADAITFTSASTVTNFVAAAGAQNAPPVVACIGPVTAAAAADAGLTVTTVATEHTIAGLVDALLRGLAVVR